MIDINLYEWHKLHLFCAGTAYQTKSLARYLHVTPRTVQRWVAGKFSPSSKQIAKIKQYLIRIAVINQRRRRRLGYPSVS